MCVCVCVQFAHSPVENDDHKPVDGSEESNDPHTTDKCNDFLKLFCCFVGFCLFVCLFVVVVVVLISK